MNYESQDGSGYKVALSYPRPFIDLMEEMYSKYGEEVFLIQGIANSHLDINKYQEEFFGNSASVAAMSVDPNGNVGNSKDIIQYNAERFKPYGRLNSIYLIYKWVTELYDEQSGREAVENVINGSIFVNDLVNFESPYCYAFDLRIMLTEGLNWFKGNFKIEAPKHSYTFINLLVQALSYISNSITGAASFPDFFPILDWFYRQEFGEDYRNNDKFDREIESQFQNLIYSLNFPFRGNQSAFTNMSMMDRGFLENLFKDYTFPDFTSVDVESTLELSKKFSLYYDKLNNEKGIFTFPVFTHALSLDKDNEYIDYDTVKWSATSNAENAWSNVFQSVPESFSSCCRLINRYDTKEYQSSMGVGGLSIGSTRVAGINLPRVAKNDRFDECLASVSKILVAHRRLIEDSVAKGVLPLYDAGWIHLSRQNSTFGIIGSYEYVKWSGYDIRTDEGKEFLATRMDQINNKIEQLTKTVKGFRGNLEQVPGESVAVRLASIDKLLGYNTDGTELYSNQYIPLIEEATFVERFDIQGYFDARTGGGAISHLHNCDGTVITPEQNLMFYDRARISGTVYFARNDVINVCEHGCRSKGTMITECPHCGGAIKKFTRVVGFTTCTESWTPKRKDYEFPLRKSGIGFETPQGHEFE